MALETYQEAIDILDRVLELEHPEECPGDGDDCNCQLTKFQNAAFYGIRLLESMYAKAKADSRQGELPLS